MNISLYARWRLPHSVLFLCLFIWHINFNISGNSVYISITENVYISVSASHLYVLLKFKSPLHLQQHLMYTFYISIFSLKLCWNSTSSILHFNTYSYVRKMRYKTEALRWSSQWEWISFQKYDLTSSLYKLKEIQHWANVHYHWVLSQEECA